MKVMCKSCFGRGKIFAMFKTTTSCTQCKGTGYIEESKLKKFTVCRKMYAEDYFEVEATSEKEAVEKASMSKGNSLNNGEIEFVEFANIDCWEAEEKE